MAKPTRPTLAQLERELRRILRTDIVIEVAELECSARVEFTKPRRIVVDPFRCGILTGVVHELLHVARYDEFDALGAVEEPAIEAAEAKVVAHINDLPGRYRWWRRAVERKLRESEAADA